MAKSAFFNEKQAAAILKHGVLGRYLRIFVSKTGVKSIGNRVVYLDGYAGPGTYDDGLPGSPMLAVKTADSLAKLRDVFGIYIEKDRQTARLLDVTLAETGHAHVVLNDELEECIDSALALLQNDEPLFAFFDPFGLPISMDSIAQIMERSQMQTGYRTGPPTEVLVTLSYPGLRRNAGHLTSTSGNERYVKARKTKLDALDRVFGGQWWREVWESGDQDRVARIAMGYTNRLAERMAARGWYRVPVSRRWNGPLVYELLFFTQYPKEGIWHFNECVSSAIESFRIFCTRGQLDLEPLEIREKLWTEAIKLNIQKV